MEMEENTVAPYTDELDSLLSSPPPPPTMEESSVVVDTATTTTTTTMPFERPADGTLHCSLCQRYLLPSEFYPSSIRNKRHQCKACGLARRRQRYRQTKNEKNEIHQWLLEALRQSGNHAILRARTSRKAFDEQEYNVPFQRVVDAADGDDTAAAATGGDDNDHQPVYEYYCARCHAYKNRSEFFSSSIEARRRRCKTCLGDEQRESRHRVRRGGDTHPPLDTHTLQVVASVLSKDVAFMQRRKRALGDEDDVDGSKKKEKDDAEEEESKSNDNPLQRTNKDDDDDEEEDDDDYEQKEEEEEEESDNDDDTSEDEDEDDDEDDDDDDDDDDDE
jgi:hypothetical protein